MCGAIDARSRENHRKIVREGDRICKVLETLPSSRSARWALLHDFIDRWYPPVMMNDGYPEAEIIAAERRLQLRLPTALTEWYLLFGNRYDLWQTQDSLCPPSQLCLDEDGLRFYYENQGCFHWSIPTANYFSKKYE